MGDGDASANTEGPTTPTSTPASAAINEGQGEHSAFATLTPTTPPCRMKLRSQDSTRAEQASLKTMKSKQLKKDGLYRFSFHKAVCRNGKSFHFCHRLKEPPLQWLCVPEAETPQAPVKSLQVR